MPASTWARATWVRASWARPVGASGNPHAEIRPVSGDVLAHVAGNGVDVPGAEFRFQGSLPELRWLGAAHQASLFPGEHVNGTE